MRLLDAFEQLHKEHPDTSLVILGGYGELFEKTVEKAQSLKAAADVAVIKYLSNPYALLKRCDYFVLSSFYEGLPVVITEADLVGLPCISTDIPGPHAFMNRYGGLLVENSTEGVLDGMKKCLAGDVP
jgi:CDP-glycerol glycerophosphotransferase